MSVNFAPVRLAEEAEFSIGPLRVLPSSRSITANDGTEQMIEPRVMQALVTLRRNAGMVVSREQLITACWDGRVVGDDAINGCIAKVRRIGDAFDAFAVETIPRVGYRLTLIDEPTGCQADSGMLIKPLVALAAGLVLAVGAWLAVGPDRPVTEAQSAPARFVVVPFRTINDDPSTRALTNGLTDEISAALNDNLLQVASRAEINPRGSAGSVAAFAIGGTGSRDGDLLRVRARLDDATDGVLLWSAEFTRPVSELYALQQEVGARIANVATIAASLRSSDHQAIESESLSLVIDSYDRYFPTDQRFIEDIAALLERAAEGSPGLGSVHAMYGSMLLASSLSLPQEEFAPRFEQARAEIELARRLAPENPQVYGALAALTHATAWSEREAIFRQGMALPTSSGNFSLVYGRFLTTAGFIDAGLRRQRRALGQPMLGQGPTWWIASSLYLDGQADEALNWLEDFLELQPDHVNARRARFVITSLERPPEQARALLSSPATRPLDLDAALEEIFDSYLTALESETAGDKQAAADFISTRWPDYLPAAGGIALLSRLGELDAAFELAEAYVNDPRTTRESYYFVPSFLFGPATGLMRRDPRFVQLMDSLGLTDYWRSTGRWPDFCASEPHSVCSLLLSKSGA